MLKCFYKTNNIYFIKALYGIVEVSKLVTLYYYGIHISVLVSGMLLNTFEI